MQDREDKMPLKGKGYSMGKKVNQVGGNSPTNFTPPNKVNQLGGNSSSTKTPAKNSRMGGNFVPGARLNP